MHVLLQNEPIRYFGWCQSIALDVMALSWAGLLPTVSRILSDIVRCKSIFLFQVAVYPAALYILLSSFHYLAISEIFRETPGTGV